MVSQAIHNANIYTSLLQMKEYNDLVIKKSPTGIIVIDSHGQIATINQESLEIFDLNKDDIKIIGESDRPTVFYDLFPENDQRRWEHMINIASSVENDYSVDRYFHNTGYVEKILSIKISPLPLLANGSNGLIMTIEDISDKVLMEKYVILSEKLVAKGEMAASVAHELNNYLAIASNNAELLSMNIDREKFDKVKYNCQTIVDNIFKIKRFVDSLMDFSKPQTEFISYNFKTLIEDLLFSLRIQPRFKQMNFTIDLKENISNIEMDVGLIQQVFMNVLNNSADAIEERAVKENNLDYHREITILSSYDTNIEKLTVTVSDNGLGMTEEILGKIFNKHFTTKKSGHGLGLANCRQIIEQHNGTMTADSKAGEGATFTITLPRYQPKK